jgi:hypothetical protein
MTENSHGQHEASLSDGVDVSAITIPFAAIVVAMLPGVLDRTILSTALPTIAGDLGRIRSAAKSDQRASKPAERPRGGGKLALQTRESHA